MKILKKTLLFLFLAIPGVMIFQFSLIYLLLYLFDKSHHLGIHPILAVIAFPLGGAMILWGTGRQKQWGFLIPFLLIPITLLAFAVLSNGQYPLGAILSTLVVIFWISSRIHYHSQWKKERKERRENPPHDPGHPKFPIE